MWSSPSSGDKSDIPDEQLGFRDSGTDGGVLGHSIYDPQTKSGEEKVCPVYPLRTDRDILLRQKSVEGP